MSTDRIRALTDRLGDSLVDQEIDADIIVVGGAAIALGVNPNRAGTVDIDVFCTNRAEVARVAAQIAHDEGLPANWLNSDAQQFMSPTARHDDLHALYENASVTIRRLDNRSLLAMKLRAGRISKDHDDIARLVNALGITTFDEAQQVFDAYYGGEERMKPTSRQLLEKLFGTE